MNQQSVNSDSNISAGNQSDKSITSDMRTILPRMALDDIPQPASDAKDIVALVKSGGSVTGYQLSDGNCVSREEGVSMAKAGHIRGVGIAHKKDTEYLKSIPDGTDSNNLSHLPTVK
jgi:hypothetical protein